jgi:putative ABC transport system permease protein
MAPVVLGLAGGVVAALAASGVLASLLYEVSARDPLTTAFVAGVLLVLALASCYLPARHATRADPLAALRCD